MKLKALYSPINLCLLIASILLLVYTGYRCFMLSFTHDESFSFIHYVNSSVADIISYNLNPIIANSHTLNTLSMKWLGGLFGNSEFVLRFHSFLAHIIYLIFTYLILKEFNSKFILIFGFIILNCNPYLLDFFSLARGYALSISLMIASIYFFVKYTKNEKNNFIYLSLLLSILSVLANFSLISFSAALIVVFELFILLKRDLTKTVLIKNIPITLTVAVLFLIYNGPIKVLVDHNELSFGGQSGLWSDTVMSSIYCYLYNSSYSDSFIVFFKFLVVFVSISSLIILYKQIKDKSLNSFSYISLIFFLILLLNIFQHLFLKGSYFMERFALFIVPLFFFSLLHVVNYLINQSKYLVIVSYIISSLTIACALTILSSINTTHCYTWQYDASSKDMLHDLSKEKTPNTKIKLGITWLFEPSINFYRETKHLNWLEPVNRDGLVGDYDYFYVDSNDLNSFDTTNTIRLKTYPISGATLFKKRNKD